MDVERKVPEGQEDLVGAHVPFDHRRQRAAREGAAVGALKSENTISATGAVGLPKTAASVSATGSAPALALARSERAGPVPATAQTVTTPIARRLATEIVLAMMARRSGCTGASLSAEGVPCR